MFTSILRRLSVPCDKMSRGELSALLEKIWSDVIMKLQQQVVTVSVVSPPSSIVADGVVNRKRGLSATPEEDRMSSTSSSKRLRSSAVEAGVVIVQTEILHVKNLDPNMHTDDITDEFKKFGKVTTFWRSICRNYCYIEVSCRLHTLTRYSIYRYSLDLFQRQPTP